MILTEYLPRFMVTCLVESIINALPKNSPPDCFLYGRLRLLSPRCLFKIKTGNANALPVLMVEVTGVEPAASASRTQRSTKLSHTSLFI